MARLPQVVVDASVVCKWFLPEVGTEIARDLRDRHIRGQLRLLAPDLLPYEVLNALRFRPGLSEVALRTAAMDLQDVQLGLMPPTGPSLRDASFEAVQRNLSIYDACYVELALRHSCPLISCDHRVLRAFPEAVDLERWNSKLLK